MEHARFQIAAAHACCSYFGVRADWSQVNAFLPTIPRGLQFPQSSLIEVFSPTRRIYNNLARESCSSLVVNARASINCVNLKSSSFFYFLLSAKSSTMCHSNKLVIPFFFMSSRHFSPDKAKPCHKNLFTFLS